MAIRNESRMHRDGSVPGTSGKGCDELVAIFRLSKVIGVGVDKRKVLYEERKNEGGEVVCHNEWRKR